MRNLLILILVPSLAASFAPQATLQRRTALLSSVTHGDGSFLYREEPTELERDVIRKEEGNPKHSSFHVVHGLETIDDKTDPAHTLHHHLIDVDHDKLDDINLRAQNAWKPVEVHEVDVDPVTLFAALFGTLAIVLFTVH